MKDIAIAINVTGDGTLLPYGPPSFLLQVVSALFLAHGVLCRSSFRRIKQMPGLYGLAQTILAPSREVEIVLR